MISVLWLLGTTTASGELIVAIDVGSGPVHSGFSSFPGFGANNNGSGPVTHTCGGITVTIDALTGHFLADRDRGDLGSSGTFTESDLLRDFLTSGDGVGIVATISGLAPGGTYDALLWSFEGLSSPFFLTDWTANGVLVQQNCSQSHDVPLSNEEYRFGFTTNADALGQIQIVGTPQDLSDGPRINGLQLSSTALPGPASLILFGTGFLELLGYGWRRRKDHCWL